MISGANLILAKMWEVTKGIICNLEVKYTRRKLLFFMYFRSEFYPGKNFGSNTSNLKTKYSGIRLMGSRLIGSFG